MESSILVVAIGLFAITALQAEGQPQPAPETSTMPVNPSQPKMSQEKSAAASRAQANLMSLFTTDDYPKEAWRNGEQGLVDVTLTVGVDGRVADCVVNGSSGSPSLDVQTCRILWARAQFTPARDAEGKPVQDTYRQRIRWELPTSDPAELEEQYAKHIIAVDDNGDLHSCRYESSPDWQAGASECDETLDQLRQGASHAPDRTMFAGNELVLETQFRIGDAQGGLEPGERPGENSLALTKFYLAVDAAGKVKSCSSESWGVARGDALRISCEGIVAMWRFEELPSKETNRNDRHVTVVNAFYLRKPPPHPQPVK